MHCIAFLVTKMQSQIQCTYVHPLQKQLLKLFHAEDLPLHDNHIGPKLFTEYQKLSLVILFRRSKKSLRDFIASLLELRWPRWLGLRRLPSKSVLHNWCKKYTTKFIRKLNKRLLADKKPKIMAIDATGIDSWQRSRHYQKRIGEAPMPYAKLSIHIDTENLLIFDHVLQIKPRHDVIAAESIFKRTSLRDVLTLGDKGYDSEPLHEVAHRKGNSLFAPVRKGSFRRRPRGRYRRLCVDGNEHYGYRNTAESCFHSLKSRRIPALKSRLHYMKKRETAWHILIHNIERINNAIRAYIRIMRSMILDRPVKYKLFYLCLYNSPYGRL